MDKNRQNVSEEERNAALALIALRGLADQANVVNPADLNNASDDSNVSIDIGITAQAQQPKQPSRVQSI